MKCAIYLFALILLFWIVDPAFGQAKVTDPPSKEIQIKIALNAAPEGQKEGAEVLGYNDRGKFKVIRKGENDLICLADDPGKDGVHVACYFKELEPFMARGRALAAKGIKSQEIRKIRGEEAASGKLKLPGKPATLYVFDADQSSANFTTGEVSDGRLRSVIYVPYLTGEDSGLPTTPVGGGMPWLMDAGTHRAHIMITPVK